VKGNGIIKHFSPAWFTMVMGTGSLANIFYLWGDRWLPGKNIGIILGALNALLFLFILVPWIVRWFTHFAQLKKELDHPVTGNFFVTMPLAAIILGSNFALMGGAFFGTSLLYFCSSAWLIGTIGSLIFGTYAGYNLVRKEKIEPSETNFAWLIPPVGSMAVPLIGTPLVKLLAANSPIFAREVFIINTAFFGLGFFLFLFIGAIVFTRLAVHALPAPAFTPTFWIPLGPIGVAAISLMGLADTAKALGLLASNELVYYTATVIWGAGLWFLGIAVLITCRNFAKENIPFTLSWWAFIFPLGAYTMATLKLAGYYASSLTFAYALALTILLVALWAMNSIHTFFGILNRSLLLPHGQPKEG
jgi:C4-dicarboxylate transporter/malic acid transport protein